MNRHETTGIAAPRVVTASGAAGESRVALENLVERIAALGWLGLSADRIILQLGSCADHPLVSMTATRLFEMLLEKNPTARIDLIGAPSLSGFPARVRALDLRTRNALRISSVLLPRGILVPDLWFEPFHLITLTAVSSDPLCRLNGVLDAQATPLHALNPMTARLPLMYEAHRLGGSDLCIVCQGSPDGGGQDKTSWWLASDCDVAAETVLAQSAGLTPEDLPQLRLISRHELLPPLPGSVDGHLPSLSAGAAWKSKLMTTGSVLKHATERVAADMSAALGNLYRVPDYVKRRLGGDVSSAE